MLRTQLTTNLLAYGLLATAGLVAIVLPRELAPSFGLAAPQQPGDTMILRSLVRDFTSKHGDFNKSLASGSGHYAGNVGLALNAAGRPPFSGGGFKVQTQWNDKNVNPIAPHLYRGTGLKLASAPALDKDAFFDSWDSTKGPYGPANSEPAPSYATGAAMPTITAPTLAPSAGNVTYKNTVTLNADLHCDNLTTEKLTILRISGHRTVLCEGNFTTGQQTQIEIMANSSLRLYVKGQIKINQTSQVNMNTWKPALCRIYNLGTSTVDINQGNQVCAIIVSPNAPMHLHQDDHIYGTFVGAGLELDQTTGFHMDVLPLADSCGAVIADIEGAPGVAGTGGIASAASFSEWYTDTLGVNLSANYQIVLTRDKDGVWETHSDSFFPIDGQLFGNESMAHNFFFTLAATTTFTHRACDSRFFEFTGADDAWLFIDGQLVLDIGGIKPNQKQRIEVDRLGLTNDQVYRLDFYYAQRNPSVASFHLRTNLDLDKSSPYVVTASVD